MDASTANLVFDHLAKLGVAELRAEYSGSGDSGQFDGFTALDAEGKYIGSFDLEKPTGEEQALLKVTARLSGSGFDGFAGLIEQAAWDAVDNSGHNGFWNNEGGRGQLVFYVDERRITLEHSNYVVSTEDSSHDIFGGDLENLNSESTEDDERDAAAS